MGEKLSPKQQMVIDRMKAGAELRWRWSGYRDEYWLYQEGAAENIPTRTGNLLRDRKLVVPDLSNEWNGSFKQAFRLSAPPPAPVESDPDTELAALEPAPQSTGRDITNTMKQALTSNLLANEPRNPMDVLIDTAVKLEPAPEPVTDWQPVVNQRVRIKANGHYHAGKIGTLFEINPEWTHHYRVQFDFDNAFEYNYDLDQIEPVTDAPAETVAQLRADGWFVAEGEDGRYTAIRGFAPDKDAQLAALRRENEALREALRPFAEFYEVIKENDQLALKADVFYTYNDVPLRLSDLKAAAQALSTDEGA